MVNFDKEFIEEYNKKADRKENLCSEKYVYIDEDGRQLLFHEKCLAELTDSEWTWGEEKAREAKFLKDFTVEHEPYDIKAEIKKGYADLANEIRNFDSFDPTLETKDGKKHFKGVKHSSQSERSVKWDKEEYPTKEEYDKEHKK